MEELNLKNKKKLLFIWSPFALGLLLLLIVRIDLYLFHTQAADVRGLLGREIAVVNVGFLSGGLVFISTIYWLLKKQWWVALQAFIAPILFVFCFLYGGLIGGAYLNAA